MPYVGGAEAWRSTVWPSTDQWDGGGEFPRMHRIGKTPESSRMKGRAIASLECRGESIERGNRFGARR